MMEWIPLFAGLLLVTGAGAAIGTLLRRGGTEAPVGWSWSYLIGFAVVGGALHIPLAINGTLTHFDFLLVACGAATLTLGFLLWRLRNWSTISWHGWILDLPRPLRWGVWATLATGLAFSLMSQPQGYDGRATFLMKARVLYDTGTIRNEDFEDVNRVHYNAHYPLLVSLVEAEMFWVRGSIADQSFGLIFFFFIVAVASIVTRELQRLVGRPAAALWGVALLWTPLILSLDEGGGLSSSVDLAFACFTTAAVIELSNWLRTKDFRRGLLAGLMLGAAALTKCEGMFWVAAIFAALPICLWQQRSQLTWRKLSTAAAGAIVLLTLLALSNLARREVPISPYFRDYAKAFRLDWLSQLGHRPFDIVAFAWKTVWDVRNWALLWPCLIGGMLVLRRRVAPAPEFRFIRIVVGLIIAIEFLIFWITPYHLPWQLRTALARLLLHFTPLAVFILAEQGLMSTWLVQLRQIWRDTAEDPAEREEDNDQSSRETTLVPLHVQLTASVPSARELSRI
jgi:hypothetical protein